MIDFLVERHNAFAATGVDADFGKGSDAYQRNLGDSTHEPNPCIGWLKKAPFYAVRIYPGDIGASCGLVTNEEAQVLCQNQSVVPGLYACGSDMGFLAGADGSMLLTLSGARVARELDSLIAHRGRPKSCVSDYGAEFTGQLVDLWAYHHHVRIDFSRPSKPTDNAHIETFNGRFRHECLNLHWFGSIAEARRLIELWRREYNESRPHMALGGQTPAEYALQADRLCRTMRLMAVGS